MLIIIINSMVISHVALKIISYLIVSMTIYLSPSLCQLDMCRLQFCQSVPGGGGGGCLGRAPWAPGNRYMSISKSILPLIKIQVLLFNA